MTKEQARLRIKKKEVVKKHREMEGEVEQQKKDQSDIYFFLHKKLDDNYDIISDLEKQQLTEGIDREEVERNYREEIELDQKEFEAKENEFKEQIRLVDNKLFGLKDIDEFKLSATTEISSLLHAIEEERKEHYQMVSDMERIAVKKKEKKKQEMLDYMKDAKVRLVEESSERVIEIKEKSEINHKSAMKLLTTNGLQASEILKNNLKVMGDNKDTIKELGISTDVRNAMAKKEIAQQKLIKELTAELQELDAEIGAAEGDIFQSTEMLSRDELAMVGAMRELEESLEVAMEGVQYSQEQAEDFTNAYEVEVQGQAELDRMLTACLTDVRKQAALVINKGGIIDSWNEDMMWDGNRLIPPRLNELSLAQRRGVLKYLLSEVRSYKIKVESFMEREGAGAGGGQGKGGGEQWDSDVRMKTGIEAWDNYTVEGYLNQILASSTVGPKKYETIGTQCEFEGFY
jgi:hypothetical protein